MLQCRRTKFEDEIRNTVVGTIVGKSFCTRAAYLGDNPKGRSRQASTNNPLYPYPPQTTLHFKQTPHGASPSRSLTI